MYQVGATPQSVQTPKVKRLKDLRYANEQLEEGLRRQQGLIGEAPFNDATECALLSSMVLEDIPRLKLNARLLGSYDKVRWEFGNFITMTMPHAAASMTMGEVGHEDHDEQWFQGYDDGGEVCVCVYCRERARCGQARAKARVQVRQGRRREHHREREGGVPKKREWQTQRGTRPAGRGSPWGKAVGGPRPACRESISQHASPWMRRGHRNKSTRRTGDNQCDKRTWPS